MEKSQAEGLKDEMLSLVGTPYAEMVAVMAKYDPFAEGAGMRKVVQQGPSKEAVKISMVLSDVGINLVAG